MRATRPVLVVLGLLWILASAAWAPAQTRAVLSAKFKVLVAQARTGGPVPVETTVHWTGRRVVRGRLEFTFEDPAGRLGRLVTGEVAIAGGDSTFRHLLPAMTARTRTGAATVQIRLVTERGTTDLGTHAIRLAPPSCRSQVIGIGQVVDYADARLAKIAASLVLESYDPVPRKAGEPASMVTRTRRLPAEGFPAQALAYCEFDVVLVAADTLAELREKQLSALLRWVEAGGSICLLTEGLVGGMPHHRAFLDQLTGSRLPWFGASRDGEPMAADTTERSGAAAEEPGRLHCYRCELGRAVIVRGALDSGVALRSTAWRQAVSFLWKLREAQRLEMLRGGRWRLPFDASASGVLPYERPDYAWRPGYLDLTDFAVPRDLRMIPMQVLLILLAAFLLTVGPLDYFVLGLIGRRWWTWIVFPLVCVGFTFATLALSSRYLGGTSADRSLTIVDLAAGGRPLRASRFEFAFAPDESVRTRRLNRSFFAEVDPACVSSDRPDAEAAGDRNPMRAARVGAPDLAGRLCGQAGYRHRVRKWTPTFFRTTRFAPPATGPDLDWDGVGRIAGPWGRTEMRSRICRTLFRGRPPGTGVVLVASMPRGEHAQVLFADAEGLDAARLGRGLTPAKLARILETLSVREPTLPYWMFGLVSGISPTGCGNFEDLAVLERRAPKQHLLAVVTATAGSLTVQRRLYSSATAVSMNLVEAKERRR